MSQETVPFDGISIESRQRVRHEERDKLREWLREEVRDAANHIGDPRAWFRLQHYSDAEMAAYADGVKNMLHGLAESSRAGNEADGWSLNTDQIAAALGERLRRLGSTNQKLRGRALNNLIEQIRDKRIALLDRYETLDYATEFRVWQKRAEKLERTDFADPQSLQDFQVLKHELHALWALHSELWSDRGWVDRRMAALREKAQVAA